MALITCPDCGKQHSDAAPACPSCGRPTGAMSASRSKPQTVEVKKKTSPLAMGCLTIIAVVFGLYLIGSLSESSGGSSSGGSGASTHTVEYVVEGSTTSASLTYENSQGGSQQEKVTVPWRTSFQLNHGHLYISAQNEEEYGGVTVRIIVDGTEVKRSDAHGAYTIASASTSL